METCFALIFTACRVLLSVKWPRKSFLYPNSSEKKPPPGPRGVPIISTIKWLRKSLFEMEASLRCLKTKFGPIISMPLGALSVILVLDRDLAHQVLHHKGAIFAGRPKIMSPNANQVNITLAGYGPIWRTVHLNLTSQILHPSRLKEYSHFRRWMLGILISCLSSAGEVAVKAVDHFRFPMFCLLVHMCFGDELEESKIREAEAIQRQLLISSARFQVLNFWPRLTRILLWKRWEELHSLRKRQQELLNPLIRARKNIVKNDTLLNLEIEDDAHGIKRKLTEEELISACSEFLSGGTDTTVTALQWIMANLVKYLDIQAKLFYEIRGVVGAEIKQVGEDDLPKMPYLKAIVLEGLRRHPPAHFLLPHSVTRDVELGGYVLPKNAVVNFEIAELGCDPNVWEDPMEFKPERLMSPTTGSDGPTEFDITGRGEIKMIPFGAGRRICPGLGLAILHLEYFVANLVWKFKWVAAEGQEVDLSEKQEFTIVMKYPLHARISPRNLP